MNDNINDAIDVLVGKILSAKAQREMDRYIADFYKSLDGHDTAFKRRAVTLATKRAMELGLSKQEAVGIAYVRDIISSRYDKDDKLVETTQNIVEAMNSVPKNVSKDTISKIHELKEEITSSHRSQEDLDKEFELLPDDESIQFIAQPDEEKREQVCHELHGTVWGKKSDIPEWAKPLIHINCKCKLVPVSRVDYVLKRVNGEKIGRKCVKPEWLRSMQGIARVKKIKGECAFEYKTVVLND